MWEKKQKFEKKLSTGEVLFKEGDTGEEMYFIREDKIKLSKGTGSEEKVLAILKEGDFFGEMALIDGSPRSATATALEDTTLIIIDKNSFMERITENPLVAYIVETLTKRLRTTDEQIKLLMIKNDERRVVTYIYNRGKEEGTQTPEGIMLKEDYDPDRLAHITGVSPEKAKEYVKNLENANLVKISSDGKLIITNMNKLEKYINFLALKEEFIG